MAAPKGHPRYGGRQKGVPNKTTASVKAALAVAYDAIGGDGNFAAWAASNSTEFYKLWAKLLPVEMHHAGPEGGQLVITWQRKPDES